MISGPHAIWIFLKRDKLGGMYFSYTLKINQIVGLYDPF